MARRARRIRLLADIYNEVDRPIGPQSESQLPNHVLEQILTQLNLKDNIRASAVCRRWHEVSLTVRRSNPSPWLMYAPKSGHTYEFFDPSERRSYYLNLPEINGFHIRYARFCWLMLFQPLTWAMSMFCPYTRQRIHLPQLQFPQGPVEMIAFSAPPTNPGCVFFTVGHVNSTVVSINTCRVGDAHWTTLYFDCPLYFSSECSQIVFWKNHFVCLTVAGEVGVFHTNNNTWSLFTTFPQKCLENTGWRARYLVEINDIFFMICTRADAKPAVYTIDRVNGGWVELDSLDGVTIFANRLSSHARTDIVGNMADNVVFSKVRFHGKRIVMFNPGHDRYYPCNQLYDWEKRESYETIWIEPPED